jgi:hypothetical protein
LINSVFGLSTYTAPTSGVLQVLKLSSVCKG